MHGECETNEKWHRLKSVPLFVCFVYSSLLLRVIRDHLLDPLDGFLNRFERIGV
jgi:hypothetical protein